MLKYFTLFCALLLANFSSAQTTTPTGSLNSPRWFHQSQPLYYGGILVFGGDNGNALSQQVYNTVELYNTETGKWSNIASMKKPRTKFTSVILANGSILAIGGIVSLSGSSALEETSSCEIYESGNWTYTDSMSTARSHHHALLLKTGKVLVTGDASGKCELYDPSLNLWYNTGNNNVAFGSGASIVLLKDGRVLATEEHNAEIYDPLTGQWTTLASQLNGDRKNHSSVLLIDGRVLLSGSENFSDQNTAEIFNPTDNSFTSISNMSEFRANSPTMLMDNGSVLAYGIGDPFKPGDTRALEVYNPQSNLWTSQSFSQIGTQGYTINKLGNGKILVTGGSWTTGNGASSNCVIIDQGLSDTPPALDLLIYGSEQCWGQPGSLTIKNSETGVQYQVFSGTTPIGDPAIGNGADLIFTINADQLAVRYNYFTIRAQKPGKTSYKLTYAGFINAKTNEATYAIADKNFLCPGDSALLQAFPDTSTSFLWNNGKSTKDIYVKTTGQYVVTTIDRNGCKASSYPIKIEGSPSFLDAGQDKTLCENASAVTLLGFPLGGYWSGKGVSTSGLFTPSIAGAGSHIISYNYCDRAKSITITVLPIVKPSVSITITEGTNPSGIGANIKITASSENGGPNPSYTFKINGSPVSGNYFSMQRTTFQNNDEIICQMASNATCATQSVVSSNVIKLTIGQAPLVERATPDRNTYVSGAMSKIEIDFNQNIKTDQPLDSNIIISGSSSSYQSFGELKINAPDKITCEPGVKFFAGEKINVALTKTLKNEFNIPVVKPLTYSFKIKSEPTVISYFKNNIFQFKQNRDGIVSNQYDYTDFCKGDFNKDGNLDFAVVNSLSSKIFILQNAGNNTFTKNQEFSVVTRNLTCGDYDNDGDLDIAYSNYQTSDIVILFNNGSGEFSDSIKFNTFNTAIQLTTADINADGQQDVVYAIQGGNTSYLVYKNAKLEVGATFFAKNDPVGLCTADIDNDFDEDIILADNKASMLYIGLNKGGGKFDQTPLEIDLKASRYEVRSVVAEDFDNDSDIDLAFTQTEAGMVSFLFNNGNGTFTTSSKVKVNASPFCINAEDYDGDGDVDIATICREDHNIDIKLNDGKGNFYGSTNLTMTDKATDLVSGDFDSDGDIDIITAAECDLTDHFKDFDIYLFSNKQPNIEVSPTFRGKYCSNSIFDVHFKTDEFYSESNKFQVQLSDAEGNFTSPIVIGTSLKSPVVCKIPQEQPAGSAYKVRVISTNPEAISTDNGTTIEILAGCPNILALSPKPNSVGASTPNEINISFSNEMNPNTASKEKIRIYSEVADISNSGNFEMTSPSNIKFTPTVPFIAGQKITVTLDSSITDINGLPLENKMIYSFYADGKTSDINNLQPKVSPKEKGPGNKFYLLDMNGDSNLDIITSIYDQYHSGQTVRFKFGDGKGNFHDDGYIDFATYMNHAFYPGDFDQDGDIDILIIESAYSANYKFKVYLNNGSCVFSLLSETEIPYTTYISCQGDFDGDGDIDLLFENDQKSEYQVFYNDGHASFSPSNIKFTLQGVSYLLSPSDIDNDGDLDIAANSWGADYFLINDGYGNFETGSQTISGSSSNVGDIDNDGDLDLISYEDIVLRKIFIYLNDGSGNFTETATLNLESYIGQMELSDFDGDNKLDILFVMSSNNVPKIHFYKNLSQGNFSLVKKVSLTNNISNLICNDVNNDGVIDIAFSDTENFTILLSQPSVSSPILPGTSLCGGSPLSLAFDAGKEVNTFVAQLSSYDGKFDFPINLTGNYTGSGNGIINTTLPEGLQMSGEYRIRINGTNPPTFGEHSIAFNLYDMGTASIFVSGNTFSTRYPYIYNFEWKLNGNTVSHSPIFIATESGDYTVTVTVPNNNCTSTSKVLKFNSSTDAINNIAESKFHLYPNPSEGYINLKIENTNLNDVELQIENSLGIRVYEQSIGNLQANFERKIDLSALCKGIYMITLKTADGVISKKLVLY